MPNMKDMGQQTVGSAPSDTSPAVTEVKVPSTGALHYPDKSTSNAMKTCPAWEEVPVQLEKARHVLGRKEVPIEVAPVMQRSSNDASDNRQTDMLEERLIGSENGKSNLRKREVPIRDIPVEQFSFDNLSASTQNQSPSLSPSPSSVDVSTGEIKDGEKMPKVQFESSSSTAGKKDDNAGVSHYQRSQSHHDEKGAGKVIPDSQKGQKAEKKGFPAIRLVPAGDAKQTNRNVNKNVVKKKLPQGQETHVEAPQLGSSSLQKCSQRGAPISGSDYVPTSIEQVPSKETYENSSRNSVSPKMEDAKETELVKIIPVMSAEDGQSSNKRTEIPVEIIRSPSTDGKSQTSDAEENRMSSSSKEETAEYLSAAKKNMQTEEMHDATHLEAHKRFFTTGDAATLIQSVYRGYSVRKSQPLAHLQVIREIRSNLSDLMLQLDSTMRHTIEPRDQKILSERIMALLLKLDAVEGRLPFVREQRKSVARDLTRMLETVDSMGQKCESSSPSWEIPSAKTGDDAVEAVEVVNREGTDLSEMKSITCQGDDEWLAPGLCESLSSAGAMALDPKETGKQDNSGPLTCAMLMAEKVEGNGSFEIEERGNEKIYAHSACEGDNGKEEVTDSTILNHVACDLPTLRIREVSYSTSEPSPSVEIDEESVPTSQDDAVLELPKLNRSASELNHQGIEVGGEIEVKHRSTESSSDVPKNVSLLNSGADRISMCTSENLVKLEEDHNTSGDDAENNYQDSRCMDMDIKTANPEVSIKDNGEINESRENQLKYQPVEAFAGQDADCAAGGGLEGCCNGAIESDAAEDIDVSNLSSGGNDVSMPEQLALLLDNIVSCANECLESKSPIPLMCPEILVDGSTVELNSSDVPHRLTIVDTLEEIVERGSEQEPLKDDQEHFQQEDQGHAGQRRVQGEQEHTRNRSLQESACTVVSCHSLNGEALPGLRELEVDGSKTEMLISHHLEQESRHEAADTHVGDDTKDPSGVSFSEKTLKKDFEGMEDSSCEDGYHAQIKEPASECFNQNIDVYSIPACHRPADHNVWLLGPEDSRTHQAFSDSGYEGNERTGSGRSTLLNTTEMSTVLSTIMPPKNEGIGISSHAENELAVSFQAQETDYMTSQVAPCDMVTCGQEIEECKESEMCVDKFAHADSESSKVGSGVSVSHGNYSACRLENDANAKTADLQREKDADLRIDEGLRCGSDVAEGLGSVVEGQQFLQSGIRDRREDICEDVKLEISDKQRIPDTECFSNLNIAADALPTIEKVSMLEQAGHLKALSPFENGVSGNDGSCMSNAVNGQQISAKVDRESFANLLGESKSLLAAVEKLTEWNERASNMIIQLSERMDRLEHARRTKQPVPTRKLNRSRKGRG
ncbi:hypothetical protein KP509_22G006500 [Ceratopteris richardii]|uniref:BAG domain-containing protein n=1 Tax=Ceratopteris richardii TaxID=49495 RepID=A0A8T2S5M4_CERRI|nr:hypothetical protein KP509_22G006500 [Ceratopteris richardii]